MIDLYQKLVGVNPRKLEERSAFAALHEVTMLVQPEFMSWAAGLWI